jgi:hypothetical protein
VYTGVIPLYEVFGNPVVSGYTPERPLQKELYDWKCKRNGNEKGMLSGLPNFRKRTKQTYFYMRVAAATGSDVLVEPSNEQITLLVLFPVSCRSRNLNSDPCLVLPLVWRRCLPLYHSLRHQQPLSQLLACTEILRNSTRAILFTPILRNGDDFLCTSQLCTR